MYCVCCVSSEYIYIYIYIYIHTYIHIPAICTHLSPLNPMRYHGPYFVGPHFDYLLTQVNVSYK